MILASYGFFKEVRPSEPYLTQYLIDNTTEDALNLDKNEVYTKVKFWCQFHQLFMLSLYACRPRKRKKYS